MLINLKKLRKEYDLSQRELAEILNISQQSINKYETRNVQPDIEILKKMADYFHTTIDYIVGREEQLQVVAGDQKIQLSIEEIALLAQYRNLHEKERECLRMLLRTWEK